MASVTSLTDRRTVGVPAATAWADDRLAWAVVIGALAFVAGMRVQALGPDLAPPGPDAGNWLAIARETFGEDVRLATAAYPPVLLVLLHRLSLLVGPLAALKVVGALSSVAVGVPFYLLARRVAPPLFAALGVAGLVLSGYHVEVLAFGGYPSLLGEALLLAALLVIDRHLEAPSRRTVWAGGLLASLTLGTHHVAALVLAAMALALAVWHGTTHGVRPVAARFGALAAATLLLAAPYLPAYLAMGSQVTRSVLNAHGWTLATIGEAFQYVFRNTLGLWYGLLGVAAVLVATRLAPLADARRLLVVLTLVPVALFVGSLEVRVLQYVFAGLVLAAVVAARVVADGGGRALAVIGLAVVVVAIGAGERAWSRQAYPWYRVATDETVYALDWLATATPRRARVAATIGPKGMPMGWWVEGYAGRRALTAVEARWLSFRDERAHAAAAATLFDPRTPPATVRALVDRYDISYLYIDKRALPHAIAQFPAYDVAFENADALILQVR